jgi:hypothetical protein
MPYAIKRKGSKYQVVNTETGKVHSTTTKAKAEKQLHLLRGIEHDWQPTEDGAYTRTINGRKVKLRIK